MILSSSDIKEEEDLMSGCVGGQERRETTCSSLPQDSHHIPCTM